MQAVLILNFISNKNMLVSVTDLKKKISNYPTGKKKKITPSDIINFLITVKKILSLQSILYCPIQINELTEATYI